MLVGYQRITVARKKIIMINMAFPAETILLQKKEVNIGFYNQHSFWPLFFTQKNDPPCNVRRRKPEEDFFCCCLAPPCAAPWKFVCEILFFYFFFFLYFFRVLLVGGGGPPNLLFQLSKPWDFVKWLVEPEIVFFLPILGGCVCDRRKAFHALQIKGFSLGSCDIKKIWEPDQYI